MNRLTQLANEYGTDKGNVHHEAHNYTEIYDHFMKGKVGKIINFLEIGINDPRFPGAGLMMWRDYFGDNMFYRGFDINLDETIMRIVASHPNTFAYYVDQTKPDQITNALLQIPTLDFVVDDGIHTFEAQVNSFFTIFPYVKRNGYYFIEDCHAKDCGKTVDLFKTLREGAMDIASIEMFNNNKLIVIKKL